MRPMIRDEDDQTCASLRRVVGYIGCSAEATEDAGSFQARFQENRPDAVILDRHLKGTDGIEQLRFLHQQGFAGPVVLISGFDQRVLTAAEQIGASLGLSIIQALTKPTRAASIREVQIGRASCRERVCQYV